MSSGRTGLLAGAAWLVVTALVFSLSIGGAKPLAAQSACNTIPFAAGTLWTLCWELRQREGLVINFADYTD